MVRIKLSLLSSVLFLCAGAAASEKLPQLSADADAVSVSGLSSGAFMAEQYQVAYSASIVGAGIVAGGPYYCAMGSVLNALRCMGQYEWFPPNSDLLWMLTRQDAKDKKIDPVKNLKARRIYIFSGTADTKVRPLAVEATARFFENAGLPSSNLVYVNTVAAGHALVTPRAGNDCAENETPFINHCAVAGKEYDQPGEILAHIYGALKPPVEADKANLLTFDQREFAAEKTSMAKDAFAYIPAQCGKGGCRVHVVFHGCKQSPEKIGDRFYWQTSYNAWAGSNNIIILYPQVVPSAPLNQDGCWDWYGYSGWDYAYKSGPQMQAVARMIKRLTMPLKPHRPPG